MGELLDLQYVFQYAAVFIKFRSLDVTKLHATSQYHSDTYICCSSTSVILILVFILVIL